LIILLRFACRDTPGQRDRTYVIVTVIVLATLAEGAGAAGTVAVGGAICIAGAVLFSPQLPSLRTEARRLIVAQRMAGGDPPE
jgi:hypothetical protein